MFLAEGLLYLEVRITEGEFCQYFWGVWKDKSVYMGLKLDLCSYLWTN
jgi:hypothetical protein